MSNGGVKLYDKDSYSPRVVWYPNVVRAGGGATMVPDGRRVRGGGLGCDVMGPPYSSHNLYNHHILTAWP